MCKSDIAFLIALFVAFAVMVLILCITISDNRVKNDNGISYQEWISPDGVHYWRTSRYNLTPRYDRNGDIMIDD